jgi:hypothetical protein
MKNMSMILSHLTNQPQFKVLKRQTCYQKFLSLLGKKWQKAIAFVYIKHETLFVVVTHPGFKMELNYNRDLLKSVLTQLASVEPACQAAASVKDVVVFVGKYHTKKETDHTVTETIPYYHETATGSFEISTDDPEIKTRFIKIKETITCNR